jgi:hypothetical protein
MSIIQEELEASRRLFLNRRPYFAPFLLRCQLFLVDSPDLFCDRHWRIYIGKDWPLVGSERSKRVRLLAAGIFHELLHLLQNHFRRGKRFFEIDVDSWMLACDCEINDDLIADLKHEKPGGMLMPADGIWPEKLQLPNGLMAEDYWKILHERKRDAPAAKLLEIWVAILRSADRKSNQTERGQCCGGGSAVGQPHPLELAADDPVSPAPTDLEKTAALSDFAHQAADWHAKHAPGTQSGWLQKLTDVWLPTPIPWHRRLEKYLREALAAGGDDYSWQRPNRRNPHRERFAMPGLVSHAGELGILVDTSGSISEADLTETFGVIKGVLRRICGSGSYVRLLACDTEAKDAGRIYSASRMPLSVLKLSRGGGTDLRVGIALAEKIGLRCLLILTDGETPWPDTRPRVPVFVALVGRRDRDLPSWAARVHVERK